MNVRQLLIINCALLIALCAFAQEKGGEAVYIGPQSTTPVYRMPMVISPGNSARDETPQPKNGAAFRAFDVSDTVTVRTAIRPGEALSVDIDPRTGTFFVNLPGDGLSATGESAVAAAPEWIREKLALQLPHFGAMADTMASLILHANDYHIDEIAFVVANLPPEAVADSRFDADLVTENAEWIYRVADSLAYVELVEDATPGNIKTTARYRCVDLSVSPLDTVWMEIPHDVYYWWIVHPVLTDEAPKKRDSGTETQQWTYGYFWREYLWTDPDPTFPYTAGGYPLLSDHMKECRYLWCRRDTMLTGMRDFMPGDGALNVLGNWTFRVVPNSPVSPRPIQPNQIAFNHGGNCGEIQDLMMAAGRTALIPSPGVVDHLEDHVWNEFFDNIYVDTIAALGWGGFPATQVNRWDYDGHTYLAPRWAGYDDQRGGSKDVSFVWDYRGDGKLFNRIDQYSSSCSLLVRVRDSEGDAVDGAIVQLYSDTPGGDPGYVYLGAVAITGADGWAKFAGGEDNPYYARAVSAIGEAPASSVVMLTSAAIAGGRYTTTINLPGSLPELDIITASVPPDSLERGLIVQWKTVSEIVRGENTFTSQELSCCDLRESGAVTGALFDSTQTANWESSLSASAWLYRKNAVADTSQFFFPDSGEYTFILSNEEGLANDQIVELTIIGIDMTAVEEKIPLPSAMTINAYPNPFNSAVSITVGEGIRPSRIEIYDISGRMVDNISVGEGPRAFPSREHTGVLPCETAWQPEASLGSGVYLIRAKFSGKSVSKRVVYLK